MDCDGLKEGTLRAPPPLADRGDVARIDSGIPIVVSYGDRRDAIAARLLASQR